MFYLIYVSAATKHMDTEELMLLLEQAREKNSHLEITGMLLYKSKSFMQMLEGEKETVLALYETIRNDERNNHPITIRMGNISERNFESWSMGFCNMDEVESLPAFDDYVKENLELKSFQDDSKGAFEFMTLFNQVN